METWTSPPTLISCERSASDGAMVDHLPVANLPNADDKYAVLWYNLFGIC
jgi:hypothetical protein